MKATLKIYIYPEAQYCMDSDRCACKFFQNDGGWCSLFGTELDYENEDPRSPLRCQECLDKFEEEK